MLKRSLLFRGMPRRGIEMRRSRPLVIASIPLSSPRRPKVVYNELDSRITGFKKDLVITTLPQPVPDDEIQCVWITEISKVLNTPGYPARIPKPRRLDLYEVRTTPDKGQGLFAKRDIKRGELILAERPLLVAPVRTLALRKSAIPNNYTKLQIRQMTDSQVESLLEAAIARLPPESQADFKALHNAHTDDLGCPLLGIVVTNCYGIAIYDDPGKGLIHGAVCKLGSRINHSCMPNVQFKSKAVSFSMQLHASRDIKAGDELVVSYLSPDSSFAERRVQLAAYGFVCKCPACVNATPEADQLRKTFEIEINSLGMAIGDPSQMVDQTLLENALTLEKNMVKEGLDAEIEFGLLLMAISWIYAWLGKVKERDMYSVRVKEFGNWEE